MGKKTFLRYFHTVIPNQQEGLLKKENLKRKCKADCMNLLVFLITDITVISYYRYYSNLKIQNLCTHTYIYIYIYGNKICTEPKLFLHSGFHFTESVANKVSFLFELIYKSQLCIII